MGTVPRGGQRQKQLPFDQLLKDWGGMILLIYLKQFLLLFGKLHIFLLFENRFVFYFPWVMLFSYMKSCILDTL